MGVTHGTVHNRRVQANPVAPLSERSYLRAGCAYVVTCLRSSLHRKFTATYHGCYNHDDFVIDRWTVPLSWEWEKRKRKLHTKMTMAIESKRVVINFSDTLSSSSTAHQVPLPHQTISRSLMLWGIIWIVCSEANPTEKELVNKEWRKTCLVSNRWYRCIALQDFHENVELWEQWEEA